MAGMTDVIDKLTERTTEGRVPWKTAFGESSFSARLGNLLVLIAARGDNSIKLSVSNEKGTEVDSVESPNLNPQVSARLNYLYNSARRTALDTDHTLEELLELLDEVPPNSLR